MARPSKQVDIRLLTKVSRLYYEEGLDGREIAERLHLSRSKVSRLLAQARKDGIVQISVVSSPGIHSDKEKWLESRYQLTEAVIADVSGLTTSDQITRAIGVAASRHLQETIQPNEVIGVSWGSTLNAMVEAVQVRRAMNNHVVQLLGGLGPPTSEVHATDLCHRLANALGCDLTLLQSPGIMDTQAAREALLRDSHVNQAMQKVSEVTTAYVGIGAPTPSAILVKDGSIIRQDDLDQLTRLGAVGDIALRFFDREGIFVQSEINERVIGITPEDLKKIDRVVGVSGGGEKVEAIHGALKGQWINVLITDHLTAEQLLELPGEK